MNPYIAQTQAVAAQQPGMQAANMGDGGASALMGLSRSFDQASQVAAQYEHQKAIQSAGKVAAEATTQWMQRLQDLKQNAPDGAPDFTANLHKEFDAYAAQTLKNTPNAVAQEFVRSRLDGLKNHLTQQAIGFQAHAQVSSAENGFKTTLEESGKIMAADTSDATYQRLQQALSDQIGTSTLPAALKLQYARMGRENLAKLQAMALTQQDPKAVYDTLKGDPNTAPQWVQDLPLNDRLSMESHAFSKWHQQMGVVRAGMEQKISDQENRFVNGMEVSSPLTKPDFLKAYPVDQAEARWNQYEAKQQLGADLVSMKNLPATELEALLKNRKTDMEAAPEGQTSAQLDRYNRTIEAAQRIMKARTDDPLGVAIQNKQYGVTPLDYSDPAGFVSGLNARQAAVTSIRSDWGVPAGPFTKEEAAKASQYLSTTSEAGTVPQMQFLQRVKQALPDPVVYSAAMRQIADGNPVIATAGHILGQNMQAIAKPAGMFSSAQMIPQEIVAGRLLDGVAALKAGKGAIGGVNEKAFRTVFTEEAGEAFASSPNALESVYESAKAYAVGKLSQSGQLKEMADGKVSTDLIRESIKAVTGGVVEINGRKTVPPYGLDKPHFEAMLMRGFESAVRGAGIPETSPLSRFDVFQFVPGGGANKYMAMTPAGTLLDPKTQAPIVIDLNEPTLWDGYGYMGKLGQSMRKAGVEQHGPKLDPIVTRTPFTGADATGPTPATNIKTVEKKPTK